MWIVLGSLSEKSRLTGRPNPKTIDFFFDAGGKQSLFSPVGEKMVPLVLRANFFRIPLFSVRREFSRSGNPKTMVLFFRIRETR